ncbi:phage tail-collar fiber domain-containing protein [Aeromonas caviae]|uniref:phage tail-collar fiber domain-containing protein n=1 Tax=Aeromonas caviae TaxID=648 RepID=UPI002B494296|nr:phage tail protein [Aeromonas caviae]
MSQVITNAFEQYWQSSLAAEQPVVLDEFILADIPNLDITSPIDLDAGLPPESQIVHRQNVDQRGRINNNAVAYTIVMDTTVGDFSFNAMYLRNKQNGVIGMIVYKGRETKLKTDQTTGQTGNSLVKSMLMGYDQAAEATLTNVDAGTWQIDYAARLRGMDEDIRQLQADLYGHHTFVGDGFKVVETDGAFQVTPGVAIVGGLRVELKQPEVIYLGTKPIGVWVDVHRAGSLLSEHQNHVTIITNVADLTDHVDNNGYQHFVAKLATVRADGTIEDGRGNIDGGGKSITEAFANLEKTDRMLTITSWEALCRSYAKVGMKVVNRFAEGSVVNSSVEVLIDCVTGKGYAYAGPYPHTVTVGETPESVGWSDRSSVTLINGLQFLDVNGIFSGITSDGQSVELFRGQTVTTGGGTQWRVKVDTPSSIDDIAPITPPNVIDFGADNTGAADSTAAFSVAGSSAYK